MHQYMCIYMCNHAHVYIHTCIYICSFVIQKCCVVQCGERKNVNLDPTKEELEARGPPALPRRARVW